MILYTPEEIKKIMEDNFERSMDLPAFYHNLLVDFGIAAIELTKHFREYPLEPKDCYDGKRFDRLKFDEVGQFAEPRLPLFTSEDGVPIYRDSKLWYANLKTKMSPVFWNLTTKEAIEQIELDYGGKFFSTKAAAEKYWEENRPEKNIEVVNGNHCSLGQAMIFPQKK